MNHVELVEDICRVIHPGAEAGGHRRDCAVAMRVLDRMQQIAANVTFTRNDDGTLTYSVDDTNGVGWVPVSLDLIPEMAANMRALFDLRDRVLALSPDWVGTPDDVLAITATRQGIVVTNPSIEVTKDQMTEHDPICPTG